VHGISMVPLLEGRPNVHWRDAIYYHYYESQAVHMVPAMYGVRTERYKLVRYYEPQWDAWELFDLQEDPNELRSVAGEPRYAPVQAQLSKRLAELRAQYGDYTGDVGGGAFPVLAGVARAVREGSGWRVRCNTVQGYLLQTGARGGASTFTTTLRPTDGAPQKNGFVVIAGGDPRAAKVRAGVEFGPRKLVILGPGRERAEVDLPWDGASAVALQVVADLQAHRIVATVGDVRVEAALPDSWTELTAWGYGASNAEVSFGELVVR